MFTGKTITASLDLELFAQYLPPRYGWENQINFILSIRTISREFDGTRGTGSLEREKKWINQRNIWRSRLAGLWLVEINEKIAISALIIIIDNLSVVSQLYPNYSVPHLPHRTHRQSIKVSRPVGRSRAIWTTVRRKKQLPRCHRVDIDLELGVLSAGLQTVFHVNTGNIFQGQGCCYFSIKLYN